MRVVRLAAFIFGIPFFALGTTEKCYRVWATGHYNTVPPERMCVGETNQDNIAQIQFLWGIKQVALFTYADMSHLAPTSTSQEVHRWYGASLDMTPGLNTFFLAIDGKINSSGEERGTVIVGQGSLTRMLNYKTED